MKSTSHGRSVALLSLVVSVGAAWGHDVSADVNVGGTPATSDNPRAGFVGLGVSGSYDVLEALSLSLSANVTRDLPGADSTQPPTNVVLVMADASWLVNENWFLSAGANLSPRVNQVSDTTLSLRTLQGGQVVVVEAPTELRSSNSSLGANLGVGYSTAGEGPVESSVDVTVGVTRYVTQQQLLDVERPQGGSLSTLCTANPTLDRCRLLQPRTDTLDQVRLGAGYTATLWEDTDVGLEGAWYLYGSDPSQVGYFPVFAFGRNTGVRIGEGIPVAPLQFTVRPSVVRRFGALTLRGWYQFGAYSGDQGTTHTAGLKVQYKFTPGFRVSLSTSGQRDVSPLGSSAPSLFVTLGTLVRF